MASDLYSSAAATVDIGREPDRTGERHRRMVAADRRRVRRLPLRPRRRSVPGTEPIAHAPASVAALRSMGKRRRLRHQQLLAHARDGGRAPRVGRRRRRARRGRDVGAHDGRDAPRLGAHTAFVIGEEGLATALASTGDRRSSPDEPCGRGRGRLGSARRPTTSSGRATAAVQRGAAVVASNDDASYPAPDGLDLAGDGRDVAALEAATGVRAEVFGKPNAPISRPPALGPGADDRSWSAIASRPTSRAPAGCGGTPLLVLTGISTRDDLGPRASPPPTWSRTCGRSSLIEPPSRRPPGYAGRTDPRSDPWPRCRTSANSSKHPSGT